jgi:hypothetical protein
MYLAAAFVAKSATNRIGFEIPEHLAENLTKSPKEGAKEDSDEGLYVGGNHQ